MNNKLGEDSAFTLMPSQLYFQCPVFFLLIHTPPFKHRLDKLAGLRQMATQTLGLEHGGNKVMDNKGGRELLDKLKYSE